MTTTGTVIEAPVWFPTTVSCVEIIDATSRGVRVNSRPTATVALAVCVSLRNVGVVALTPASNPLPTKIAASESNNFTVYPNHAPLSPCEVVGRIGIAFACPAVSTILVIPIEMIGISFVPLGSVTSLNLIP